MPKPATYAALNRLMTIVYRSLPMYLTYACPWTHEGDETASAALKRIVDDEKQLSERIAAYILDHHGPLEMGEYPLDFPDTHDLSLDYLISKLVDCQKKDIGGLEVCVAALAGDREGLVLADEALGAARGHLETLEELAKSVSKPESWTKN
jgi:hypothetical protein